MNDNNLPKLLHDAEEEIKRLKSALLSWKTSWFDMRETSGRSYWDGFKNGQRVNRGIDPKLLERWKKLPPHNID